MNVYKVAKILVKPTLADKRVCPTPHRSAYNGCIGKLDALYTYAIVALLTAPDTTGVKTPINSRRIGKNFPNLCFRNVRNAIRAAICKKCISKHFTYLLV